MWRSVLSVIAGLVVGIIIISLIQKLSHWLYPFPAGTDWTNPEAARIAFQKIPTGSLLMVLFGYISGSFVAGLVTGLIAPQAATRNAVIAGGILMLAGLVNLMMLPHPGWFWISMLVYIPFAWLGARSALRMGKRPLM